MNYLLKENETSLEFAQRLQNELDEYKKQVSEIKDIEELNKLENACQESLQAYDEYIKNVTYTLASEVTFDGKKYKKSDIAKAIVYFISKIEVKWDYTLGLYELTKLWKNGDPDVLTFGQMDSTLRCLDQVMFKGFNEWADILAINEYFKANHEEFSIDTATHIYLAQRHNAVLERIDLCSVAE